jgi:hypothetical protein
MNSRSNDRIKSSILVYIATTVLTMLLMMPLQKPVHANAAGVGDAPPLEELAADRNAGVNWLEDDSTTFRYTAPRTIEIIRPVRYVPIRWIELHAPRHAECQGPGGVPFGGPIPTSGAGTWRTSEWAHWVIAKMNETYTGTGIQFWLRSYEAYCTRVVARFLRDSAGDPMPEQLIAPFTGAEVLDDIEMLFPHADLSDLGLSESLRRERWLQRAFALYGDPHGMPIFVHSDFLDAGGSPGLPYADTDGWHENDYVLPQHGYFPWDSPGLAFIFLSGISQGPRWQVPPEAVPSHELGHAFGNVHTHDFHGLIEHGAFPDGSPYTWADHWDLAHVDTGPEVRAFGSREEAQDWIATHGTDRLRRIDERWNVILDKDSGRMSVRLSYDREQTVHSETQVETVAGGTARMLQGLSFDFTYEGGDPPHTYSWQRNVMAYRYPEVYDPFPRVDSIDPYDYLAARFSQSQIEVMQRQLDGSTAFLATDYGTIPAGKESYFATRFNLLGDGKTEDFVWYSNGEGPASVDPGDDRPDMIAFRAAPAGTTGLDSNAQLVAGDFNGDGLTDLLWHDANNMMTFLWSRLEMQGGGNGVHRWDQETVGPALTGLVGHEVVFAGDFDGNGADDLFFGEPITDPSGGGIIVPVTQDPETVVYFKNDPTCRSYVFCLSHVTSLDLQDITGPVAVGDFDSANGDDFVWASYSHGTTYASILWSDESGGFTPGQWITVGSGRYVPHAGNYNGSGGDDVLWLDPTNTPEIVWWGGTGGERRMLCGPGGSWNCVDRGWNVASRSPRVTIGDFDGNGADDILIHDSHEPSVCFSARGNHLTYAGNHVRLRVALHNAVHYLTAVGEFDGVTSGGDRLGDDVFLYFRPDVE